MDFYEVFVASHFISIHTAVGLTVALLSPSLSPWLSPSKNVDES